MAADISKLNRHDTGIKVSGIVEPRILNAYSFIRLGADRIGTRAAARIVEALARVRQNSLG